MTAKPLPPWIDPRLLSPSKRAEFDYRHGVPRERNPYPSGRIGRGKGHAWDRAWHRCWLNDQKKNGKR